jgi:hypothetical protein
MAKPEWPKVLAADIDAYFRNTNVYAGPAIAIAIFVMIANDHIGIGLVHALGYGCSVVAPCSALATCESANHRAAVATPIKILLIFIASAAYLL